MQVNQVEDFLILQLKISEQSNVVRHLFIKKHEGKGNDPQFENRTLFMINVPEYLNRNCIQHLFKECGEIDRVYFHQKPSGSQLCTNQRTSKYFTKSKVIEGYKVTYVVFKDTHGLKNALELPTKGIQTIEVKKLNPNIGVRKWAREYNSSFVEPQNLQKEIESFMSEYDKKVEEEKQKAKEAEGVPDDEGWITVGKHSKKKKISNSDAANFRLMKKHKKEESKRALLNFYKFQIKQTNMEHLAQLRKKFQEDKEKIALMRANRKFKPF